MRCFIIVVDAIYECSVKLNDDESVTVFSSPPGSGLNGCIFKPWRWSLIKDSAYLQLENECEMNRRRWIDYSEQYKVDPLKQKDYEFALEQIKIFKELESQSRLMNPNLIKWMK